MSDLSPTAVRAAAELRRMVALLRRRLREIRSVEEIPGGSLSVLTRLDKEGPATAAGLAAMERVRPQSMRTKILSLEASGLIARRADDTDGRRLVIDLTDLGRERVEGDRAARREWLSEAFDQRYTAEERDQLLAAFALLERLFADEAR